nr:MAG TPA_asm: hypothetical protein [Caudoviricetes sp.]
MMDESVEECCMVILSLKKRSQTQWLKSKTSVDAVFVLPSRPKIFLMWLPLRLKSAAHIKYATFFNQCFLEPSGGPSLFIRCAVFSRSVTSLFTRLRAATIPLRTSMIALRIIETFAASSLAAAAITSSCAIRALLDTGLSDLSNVRTASPIMTSVSFSSSLLYILASLITNQWPCCGPVSVRRCDCGHLIRGGSAGLLN